MRPCVLLLLLNLSDFIEVCAHYYVAYTYGAKLESMRFCVQLLHYNESGCIELSVRTTCQVPTEHRLWTMFAESGCAEVYVQYYVVYS